MTKTEQNNYNEVFELEKKYYEQYKQQPTLAQWEQFLIDNSNK